MVGETEDEEEVKEERREPLIPQYGILQRYLEPYISHPYRQESVKDTRIVESREITRTDDLSA
jgi:hypothetical protein